MLALYTYKSGLRAPALIAFVKDVLIYMVIIVAVIYLPCEIRWLERDLRCGPGEVRRRRRRRPTASCSTANNQLQYATLALGSALALFLYPHSATGILASRGRNVIKKNMIALPAYSFLLGLLALLGYVAITAGVEADHQRVDRPAGQQHPRAGAVRQPVPRLVRRDRLRRHRYRRPGAGGDHVDRRGQPVDPQHLQGVPRKDATPKQEATQAKWASLVVKFGAVAFILFIDPQFSIDLQLIGGVIILQTLPAVAIALYTRWLHSKALIAGWVVGMGWGLYLLWTIPNPAIGKEHFGGSALTLSQAVDLRLAPVRGIDRADLRRHRRAGWPTCWWRWWSPSHPADGRGPGRSRCHQGQGLSRRRGRSAVARDRGALITWSRGEVNGRRRRQRCAR